MTCEYREWRIHRTLTYPSLCHGTPQALRDRLSGQQVESVRSGAAAEQQVASLREQLAARDEEARRVKYDAASVQMQLEKVRRGGEGGEAVTAPGLRGLARAAGEARAPGR